MIFCLKINIAVTLHFLGWDLKKPYLFFTLNHLDNTVIDICNANLTRAFAIQGTASGDEESSQIIDTEISHLEELKAILQGKYSIV